MSLKGEESVKLGLIVKMKGGEKLSLEQIRVLLEASEEVEFQGVSRPET